jgi:streptogramin lyase/tRNA A-37 threonylcarbamoyl transferase component Bud32
VDLTSLSSNYVQSIYRDKSGILWVGTDSGLNKFDKKRRRFGHCKMEPGNANSLSDNKVWSICKDRKGYVWVGTEGGLDRMGNKCIHIELGSPGTRRIYSIHEDRRGILWIGTVGDGLYRFHTEKGTRKHYKHNAEKRGTLSDDNINTICEDSTGTLWFGTRNGLNRFEPKTETFDCYKKSENLPEKIGPFSLSDNCISKIYEDQSHVLWIGTRNGLSRFYRESETFYHWRKEPGDPGSLSNNIITAICEDKKGVLWIGTHGGGLNRFDRERKAFEHYLEKDGLPNKIINGILEDKEGNLWLSTNKGISRFDPKSEHFKNYDMWDGLQDNEFNGGAYFKSDDGKMFFGGSNGFNAFYPDEIEDNPHVPPIVITDFQILNEPVKIGSNSPLKHSITGTKEIVLSHKDNVFSFEFAALDFSNPRKNRYLYKMEGFDRDWNERDSTRRFVTYTNLDPGKYVFRVRGSNNDGVWNKKGTAVKIIITPPFWKTWWFRLLAILGFAVLSYVIINFIRKYITLSGFWKGEKYIGKFKLLDKIGSGGMGTIYKAQDTLTKSGKVALKVLRDDLFMSEHHRKRFKQEAVIIDQLDHPNIVKIMERGQFEQKLYIVMELLEGKTLTKKIEEEEKIDLKEALDIIIQVADALKKIHSKNIVHRDLKPDNVMLVEKEGKRNFVKLLDFGLARTEHQTRITQTGTVLGTLNYMAPEQISHGEFSLASDVYSLGVICYETLTRKVPFPGGKMTDIMRKILNDTPTEPIHYRPDMPTEFNVLIMQMIEKESGRRPTVEEVMEKLKAMVNGQ